MKFSNILFSYILSIGLGSGQIVKITPNSPTISDAIEIVFDVIQGNAGLAGASSVYMHSGVVIDKPDGTAWEYVKGNWGKDDGICKMTKVPNEPNLWSIKIPNINTYYGIPDNLPVFRLSMVFRNADGSKEGKGNIGSFEGGSVASNGDIYLDLKNYVQTLQPTASIIFLVTKAVLPVSIKASGLADKIVVFFDEGKGFQLISEIENATILNTEITPSKTGLVILKAEAIFGTDTQSVSKEFQFVYKREISTANLPSGQKKGINYAADNSKVTLVLEGPQKQFVYAVGDFSNWEIKDKFLMNKTAEGDLFWLEIDNLIPQKEYVFQYWVDGTIKIPDPYADKIADPWNDKYISDSVYPNLPKYEQQTFGVASVFQTGQKAFNWNESEKKWQRPAKQELRIYELLVRDFIRSHNYKDLTDTLSYLKKLGVNAIELMPIMEFEGNESWGYNVSQYFAPDKYYGTKNDLKCFIQTAHQLGLAVILDMVLNHAFGQNPLVKMYWDSSNNKPAANSPYFNQDAKHLYNVGYDFNHESPYTQAFVDSVNAYWLREYHFDGFRFDLSKGFTQKQTNTDVSFSARDESRIAILKRMAQKIEAVDKNAYVILEHFADASEESTLHAEGMMTWGNHNHDFADLMLGKIAQSLSSIDDTNRVSYMESHDEQRQIYLAKNGSAALNSTYNPKSERVAFNRLKMMSAFFFTQPGPKMMWQFQELGYDIDINFNGRVGNKPLVWGNESLNYYEHGERQKLFKTNAAILNLLNNHSKVFNEGKLTKNMSGAIKSLKFEHDNLDVAIIGNFDIKNTNTSFSFPKNGWWFDYFQKDSLEVKDVVNFTFSPGEFHIYTSIKQKGVEDSLITFFEARDTTITRGEIVSVSPIVFQPGSEITIIFDAKEADANGTMGLINTSKVYMHAGIITSSESGIDWQYVTGNWGKDDGIGKMTKVEGTDDKWQIKLIPKNYFKAVHANAQWYRIGMVFRNEDGTKEGKNLGGTDLFVNFTEKQIKEVLLSNGPDSNLIIYPNPSSHYFKIEENGNIEEVVLYDLKGKIVKKFPVQEQYAIQDVPAGMYLLLLKLEEGQKIKRVIIH